MKKFVTTIVAAALCCAVSITAFAAPSPTTPVEVTGLTVYDAEGNVITVDPEEGGVRLEGADTAEAKADPATQYMEDVVGTDEKLKEVFPDLAGKEIYGKLYITKWGIFPEEFGRFNATVHVPGLVGRTVYVIQYAEGTWQFGNGTTASVVKNQTTMVGAAKGAAAMATREVAAAETTNKYYKTTVDANGNITVPFTHFGPFYLVVDPAEAPTTPPAEPTTPPTNPTAPPTNPTTPPTEAPTIPGGQGGQTGDRSNAPLYAAVAVLAVGVAAVAFIGFKKEKGKK